MPVIEMSYVIKHPPASSLGFGGHQFRFFRVSEGEGGAQVQILRETKQRSCRLRVMNRGNTGTDAHFPGSQLHVCRCLASIEHDRPALCGIGRDDGNTQGGVG